MDFKVLKNAPIATINIFENRFGRVPQRLPAPSSLQAASSEVKAVPMLSVGTRSAGVIRVGVGIVPRLGRSHAASAAGRCRQAETEAAAGHQSFHQPLAASPCRPQAAARRDTPPLKPAPHRIRQRYSGPVCDRPSASRPVPSRQKKTAPLEVI